ncbi:polyprenyl synthetase family protein [Cupriavidus basilensis]
MEILSNATNVIAEGEVLQLLNMHDPDVTVERYLQVIRYKTAKLFEASAQLGAVLAPASTPPPRRPRQCTAGASGTAFQLIDDMLDYPPAPSRWARTPATTRAKASRPCRCCICSSTVPPRQRAGPRGHRAEAAPSISMPCSRQSTPAAHWRSPSRQLQREADAAEKAARQFPDSPLEAKR